MHRLSELKWKAAICLSEFFLKDETFFLAVLGDPNRLLSHHVVSVPWATCTWESFVHRCSTRAMTSFLQGTPAGYLRFGMFWSFLNAKSTSGTKSYTVDLSSCVTELRRPVRAVMWLWTHPVQSHLVPMTLAQCHVHLHILTFFLDVIWDDTFLNLFEKLNDLEIP